MQLQKFVLLIYTHSLSNSLRFYVHETNWFSLDIDFGMNYVRLQANFHPSIFLEIYEKSDYDYLTILKPTLKFYIDNLDAELTRLKTIDFKSGATFLPFQGQEIFEYPAGRFFAFLDPTGNEIQFCDNRYM